MIRHAWTLIATLGWKSKFMAQQIESSVKWQNNSTESSIETHLFHHTSAKKQPWTFEPWTRERLPFFFFSICYSLSGACATSLSIINKLFIINHNNGLGGLYATCGWFAFDVIQLSCQKMSLLPLHSYPHFFNHLHPFPIPGLIKYQIPFNLLSLRLLTLFVRFVTMFVRYGLGPRRVVPRYHLRELSQWNRFLGIVRGTALRHLRQAGRIIGLDRNELSVYSSKES